MLKADVDPQPTHGQFLSDYQSHNEIMELMDGELPSSPGELPLWWFPTPHLNLSVYPSLEARVCDRCLLMVQDKVGVMKVGWELARGWTVNKEE